MKAYIAVTDRDWYDHLRRMNPAPVEVNFWKPSGGMGFQALTLGQPLIFKLHYPENAIVGAGFFGHFSRLPTSLAWDAFGECNGALTLSQMRVRIEKYRKTPPSRDDYEIGCILLEEPFFLDEIDWISAPD
ncbi:MAG: HNH endonuclease, partial [Gemmatimonadales bacterium]